MAGIATDDEEGGRRNRDQRETGGTEGDEELGTGRWCWEEEEPSSTEDRHTEL